jgi:hypothetical protein
VKEINDFVNTKSMWVSCIDTEKIEKILMVNFFSCICIKTVEVGFFVTRLDTLQILGVEMSTGGSTESNVRSFEAFLTIYL